MKFHQERIHLPKPCPMSLSRMTKSGLDYQCKSCNKLVYDFRDKSFSEIKNFAGKGVCGIFDSQQVLETKKPMLSYRIKFAFLSFASLLGFAVSPIQAQELTLQNIGYSDFSPTDSTNTQKKSEKIWSEKKIKRKRKKSSKKRAKSGAIGFFILPSE